MISNQVIIATNSGDLPNYHLVAKHLTTRGYEPIIIEADSIANGRASFNMKLTSSGGLLAMYKGRVLDMPNIGAAWYRRPHFYGNLKNELRWLMIKEEYEATHDSIFGLVPEDAWLNTLEHMRVADVKFPQLLTAAKLGFEIPVSTISNTWAAVETLPSNDVIVKFITHVSIPAKKRGL